MAHTRLSRLVISASMPVQRARLRRRLGRLIIEHVQGIPIVVLPDVFNPAVFRSTDVFVRALRSRPAPLTAGPRRALDMGTGSGVLAIAAARLGYEVTAVDVNPEAVRCATINCLLNRVERHVQVREGDLYEPIRGERFDLVLFNPPYFAGAPETPLDQAWRSIDVPERFGAGLPGALAPGGCALVSLTSHGGGERMTGSLRQAGLSVASCHEEDLGNEVFTIVEARRPVDQS